VAATAQLLLARNDVAESLHHCRRISIDEHCSAGLTVYAQTLYRAADSSEAAIPVYRQYLIAHPRDADIRLQLARALMLKGSVVEAVETYQVGVFLDPRDIRLRYHLALALKMEDETEAAMAELQNIMRTDGFDSYRSRDDISRLLSKCFIEKNMLEAAMKQLLATVRSPDTLEALYELGNSFEASGDHSNARACWEEVYAVDVKFRDVSQRLSCSSLRQPRVIK